MFLAPAVLLATLIIVSVALDRRLQARKQTDETAPEAPSITDRLARFGPSRDWFKSWRDKILRRQPGNLPQQFRAWITGVSETEAPLKQWLEGLSEDGWQAFTTYLVEFCSNMGFELAWLVRQQLDKNPELAQAATKVVLDYCRACQQAAEAQDDIEVYKTFRAFEQHPFRKKSQAFGQKLFAKLVEAGLASVSTEFLTASPKEAPQHMVRIINEVAEQNNEAFNRVLKEVVRDLDTESTAPQTSAAPATLRSEGQEGTAAASPA
ncbi:hypothetical protein NKDENANG_03693 [Candidatus Entotheonellaceae bacterium PAL068K]